MLDLDGPIAGTRLINTNGTKTGYLKLIGDFGSSGTGNRYSNFSVVDVTGVTNNINLIGNNNSNLDTKPDVIIFASKIQANSIGAGTYNTPTYRAFEVGNARKYAPNSFGGKIGSPTNPSGSVHDLREQEREATASATGAAPSMINASGNTWDNINDLVALSPASSGIYLAGITPRALRILPAARKRDGEQAG